MIRHGGDWAGFQAEYGRLPLDFSANVSPLGLPDGVRRAAEQAVAEADRYPDPACRDLRRALADRFCLPGEHIVCGNGAADLIWRLALALRPRRAVIPVPTFVEYRQALETAGCDCTLFPLRAEEDFALTDRLLDALTPGTDLLVLCQPNNPTGRTADGELLRRVAAVCRERGVTLLCDECFLDLTADPAARTLAGEWEERPHVVVLGAFTKRFAMAGLRLGYALCGSRETAEKLRRAGPPWAVSHVAQAAGLAALKETAYTARLDALIAAERPRLAAGLTALGARVVPGEANFLLFFHPAADLCERLRPQGILLRGAADFDGLGPGWYRTAVRTGPDNDRLLNALKEVLRHG